MLEIGRKDRIFLMAAVPAAALAAYVYFFAMPAGERMAVLEARESALVAAEDHPARKAALETRLAKAQAALEEEKSLPAPEAEVSGDASLGDAARQRALFASLAARRLRVLRSKPDTVDGALASEALKATGAVPSPVKLKLLVEGAYPDLLSALEAFSSGKSAVIPESVGFAIGARNRWEVSVWL